MDYALKLNQFEELSDEEMQVVDGGVIVIDDLILIGMGWLFASFMDAIINGIKNGFYW